MVRQINEYYIFDEPIQDAQDTQVVFEDIQIPFNDPTILFNASDVHYTLQPDNKINQVHVNREADLIFKKGDYLHAYVTINSEGIPDGTILKLKDERGYQLYSPFTPDGIYEKYECKIIVGEIDVIPLPADYSHFKTWIDFEPGIYNWKLVSTESEYYDSTSIDIQIEIRDFETWEPFKNIIYPEESVIYKVRTCMDTIPYTTDLLTENATYDPDLGYITYPPSDLDITPGPHYQPVGNRYIYYEVTNAIDYLIYFALDANGDFEYDMGSTRNYDLSQFINDLDIDIEDLDIDVDSGESNYVINGLMIDKNGNLIFDINELSDDDD